MSQRAPLDLIAGEPDRHEVIEELTDYINDCLTGTHPLGCDIVDAEVDDGGGSFIYRRPAPGGKRFAYRFLLVGVEEDR